MNQHVNDDILAACAHLVDRAGANGFEIGYVHEDVPVEQAGWYAHAQYRGARITSADHTSPTNAALGLAERILTGGTCRCGHPVTIRDDKPGCRWRLMGDRWQPGCDAPPMKVDGDRGDLAAIQAAANPPRNRAQRRAQLRDQRRRR